MKQSVNQIRVELEAIGDAHQQVNTYFWGDLLRAWKENEVEYPLMCCYYPDGAMYTNQTQLQLVIVVADKIYKDWGENLNEVESDTLQICRDIYQTINMSTRWQQILRVESCTVGKFINDTGDEVAGHTMTFTVRLRDNSGICGLPMGNYDFDQLVGDACEDSTVKNSDGSYITTVASGSTLILPDDTYEIYVNGVLDQTFTNPSIKDTTINIQP